MKTNFNQPSLGPELYDQDYYLKSLPGLEYLEPNKIDPAVMETIRFGAIAAGNKVLDFGCGRGRNSKPRSILSAHDEGSPV